jgi:elongation factor G
VPVLCGSAFKNKGVQPLLDAVVDYLPSPLDIPTSRASTPGQRRSRQRPADDEPLSRLAFKIMNDPFVGSLTFMPHLFGQARPRASTYLNSVKDKKERVGRMLLMHANNREDIEEAYAGDIVALAGLKETTTGDTLCDPAQAGHPRADGIPRAGHRDRVEPKTKADQEKMGIALNAWPPRIRPSASRPIRNRARPSSRAWANFTSTSRSTA